MTTDQAREQLGRLRSLFKSVKIDRDALSRNVRLIGIYGIVILVVIKFVLIPLKGSLEGKVRALADYRAAVAEAEVRVQRISERSQATLTRESLSLVFGKEKTEYAVQADMLQYLLGLVQKHRLVLNNFELPASAKGQLMREVFVLLRFKGPVKGTVEFFKDSALLDYTPDFIKDEFAASLTVEKLCQAVDAEKLPFRLKSKENTIDRLNELLKIPDFYDKLTAAKTNAALSDTLKALAGKTEEMRKDVPPLGLGAEDDLTVKKLNRLLMEEVYKDLTPKRRSPKAIDMKNLQIDRSGNDLVVVATFAAYKAEK